MEDYLEKQLVSRKKQRRNEGKPGGIRKVACLQPLKRRGKLKSKKKGQVN